MDRRWILVALGGALGAIARYALAGLIKRAGALPYGTLAVNVLGSLLIGFFLGHELLAAEAAHDWRLFLVPGFLGAFTTFSAFSYETFALLAKNDFHLAGLNIALNLSLGLAGVWVGYTLGKAV